MVGKVAVGYARSSGKVNPKSSIPNQIDIIRKYSEDKNIILQDIFIDECKTGTKVDGRTSYQLLKDFLKDHDEVDILLVAFFDRLGREAYELILGYEGIKENNVELIFISEGLSSKYITPSQLAMLALQSEMENKMRHKRISDSKNQKIKQGKYLFSNVPPYGYNFDENRMLAINPEKVEIVRQIFNLFLKGKNTTEIYQFIKGNFKNNGLKNWQINRILTNKTYTGYIYNRDKNKAAYKKLSDVRHPQIVPIEIFEKCQEILQVRAKENKKRQGREKFYLLNNGIFLCPLCRKKISGNKTKYKCNNGHWEMDLGELESKVLEFLELSESNSQENELKISKLKILKERGKEAEVMFASGVITYHKFKKKLKETEEQTNLLHKDIINSKQRVCTTLIKNGSLELLKKYLLKEKIELTLNKNKQVVRLEG